MNINIYTHDFVVHSSCWWQRRRERRRWCRCWNWKSGASTKGAKWRRKKIYMRFVRVRKNKSVRNPVIINCLFVFHWLSNSNALGFVEHHQCTIAWLPVLATFPCILWWFEIFTYTLSQVQPNKMLNKYMSIESYVPFFSILFYLFRDFPPQLCAKRNRVQTKKINLK